jgi:hypothetical protein
VAGGGYTGVEVIAELQHLAAEILHLYPRCAAQGMRWLLVESGDQITREVPEDLAELTAGELRRRGPDGMAIPGMRRRIHLLIDWTVELFFRGDSAEWIPPRLPRLSLAVIRDPEAVELSVKPATVDDAGSAERTHALEP